MLLCGVGVGGGGGGVVTSVKILSLENVSKVGVYGGGGVNITVQKR